MTGTSRLEQIQRLMALKYPGLSTFKEIQNRERIPGGATDPIVKQEKEFIHKLTTLEGEEFQTFVATETERVNAAYRAKWEEEERKRFFNAPGSAAALHHWARAAYWSLDEAVALSFGKEPNLVTWDKVRPHLQVSPFAMNFSARRDLAIRAKGVGQLFDPVLPGLFLGWAKRMKMDFPAELESLVQEFGGYVGDWKLLYDQLNDSTSKTIEDLSTRITAQAEAFKGQFEKMDASSRTLAATQNDVISKLQAELQGERAKSAATLPVPISERERESLLKLVIGMAKGGYGYDPKAPRSTTAKDVASDLLLNGVPLSEDTVRKYMREAANLLPLDEDEQKKT